MLSDIIKVQGKNEKPYTCQERVHVYKEPAQSTSIYRLSAGDRIIDEFVKSLDQKKRKQYHGQK